MNIYLSAAFVRQEEMRAIRDQIQEIGHEVVSSWVDESTEDDKTEVADRDWKDVEKAELLILFSEPEGVERGRGGRHVELGMAYALYQEVWVIGRRENIFHFLPYVEVFSVWAEALERLSPWPWEDFGG